METNINTIVQRKDDQFMKRFKYYKSNKPKPSLAKVLSVDNYNLENEIQIQKLTPDIVTDDFRAELLGLQPLKEWQTFNFLNHPGLIFIRNPFTTNGQRYWIRKCLETYPRKPNKLNIDIETNTQDWWKECHQGGDCDKRLIKKLRWTTLGYHHNWDTKVYNEDDKSVFPEDLAELSDVIANYMGYTGFKAEAAIINYYHMNSTLSAHTDHSEVNLEAPLFSFSFGQSAIFLIGGREKSIEPSAILLNSGDIVIMSKEARLCYHAVPKILPSCTSPWDLSDKLIPISVIPSDSFKYISYPKQIASYSIDTINKDKWNVFGNYIRESRININVRQVLNENQTYLNQAVFIDK